MRRLFKEDKAQEQFEEDGFAIIRDFMSQEDVAELLELYERTYPQLPDGFVSSSYSDDYEFKQRVCDEAQKVLAPRIAEHLMDSRPLGSAFLVKAPGKGSVLPMHQDWTIVDEDEFVAVNVWTPLTPVSAENGTLEMLPGGHRTFKTIRTPTMPFIAMGSEDLIHPHMVKMQVKPGDAVVLNQACIHYSAPNMTEKPRVAITSGVVSKDAPLQFGYYDNEASTLETFEMDDDFLLKFESFHEAIFSRPKQGRSIGVKPIEYAVLSREEVAKRLPQLKHEAGNQQKPGFLKRLVNSIWS